jgi:predicted nucleic acid-binding protein
LGRVILDTSVLIAAYSIKDAHHQSAINALSEGHDYSVSVLTISEILVAPFRVDQRAAEAFLLRIKKVLSATHEVSEDISVLAAQLRAEKGLKIPDAIIAATALIHKAELWTFDKKLAQSIKKSRLLK